MHMSVELGAADMPREGDSTAEVVFVSVNARLTASSSSNLPFTASTYDGQVSALRSKLAFVHP